MDKITSYMHSLDIPPSYLITASVIVLSVIYYWLKRRSVLPGPKGLSYLGLYPFLTDENVLYKLEEYKEKYGDLFSFTYTGKLYINLGSIKAMREIQTQKSDCFVDRFKDSNIFVEMISNGMFVANGDRWKVFRKFFIQKLKVYGLSAVRGDMAGPLYDSLNAATEHLKALCENPVNIVEFTSQHSSIVMRKIIFGEEGVTDDEIGKIGVEFVQALEGTFGVNMLLIGPFARFLFTVKPSFRKNFKHYRNMRKMLLGCMKRLESSLIEDDPTCIVEDFYKERNERKRKNDPTWKYFTDDALVDSLFQFVGDGIGTVAAFIAGILNTLIIYPEEQDKIYNEIMEVVGRNRQPTAEDRPNMPYTCAFLNEFARMSKTLIFFPSLECTKETTVRGYKIPVGSVTLLNIWSAHHDKDTFEDPHTFKPSRYLSSNEKGKAESPVLFGMGKRVCTGEPFVWLQSFLFLTTIVKNFKIVSSNALNTESVEFIIQGKLELTFAPRKDI